MSNQAIDSAMSEHAPRHRIRELEHERDKLRELLDRARRRVAEFELGSQIARVRRRRDSPPAS